MSTKCECGCGGITNGKWKYLRGHKTNTKLVVNPPVDETPLDEGEPTSFELTLTVTEQQIDVLWQRLAPIEKANAIVGALQASLDATSGAQS